MRAVGADVGSLQAEEVLDWLGVFGARVDRGIVNALIWNAVRKRRRVGRGLMRSAMESIWKLNEAFPWFKPDWFVYFV